MLDVNNAATTGFIAGIFPTLSLRFCLLKQYAPQSKDQQYSFIVTSHK